MTQSRRTLLLRLLASLLVTAVGLLLLEGGTRLALAFVFRDFGRTVHEFRMRWYPDEPPPLLYRPHPYMAYVHAGSNAEGEVDRFGFYGRDRSVDKPAGTLRVGCFGGSTTAGPRSWPYQMERLLQERARGRVVEVFNFGVAGWTSAEAVAAYTLLAQDYGLDVVVIHLANNDIVPIRARDPAPDYTHFRSVMALEAGEDSATLDRVRETSPADRVLGRWSDLYLATRVRLEPGPPQHARLDGLTRKPFPMGDISERGAAIYLRNLRTIATLARSRGSTVVLSTEPWMDTWGAGSPMPERDRAEWTRMIVSQNDRVRSLAASEGLLLADVDREMERVASEFVDPIHLTEAGDQRKAAAIARVIVASGALDPKPAETAPPVPGGTP